MYKITQPQFFRGIVKGKCPGCGIRLAEQETALFEKIIYCFECAERRLAGVPPEGIELTQEMIDKLIDA